MPQKPWESERNKSPGVTVAQGDEWPWETMPAEGLWGGRGLCGFRRESEQNPAINQFPCYQCQEAGDCPLRDLTILAGLLSSSSQPYRPQALAHLCSTAGQDQSQPPRSSLGLGGGAGETHLPCLPRFCETHFISSGSTALASIS